MPAAPPERPRWRRWLPRLLSVVGGLLLLLAACVLVLAMLLNSAGGRVWLSSQVVVLVNRGDELQIRLSDLRSPTLGRWQVAGLELIKRDGLRLRLDRLDLAFRPYQLLQQELRIEHLRLGYLQLQLPSANAAGTEPAGPLALPYLQRIVLHQLRVEALDIGGIGNPLDGAEDGLRLQQLEVSVDWLLQQQLDARLSLATRDEPQAHLQLQLGTSDLRHFQLRGTLRENPGGLLGERLRLPASQALDATFDVGVRRDDDRISAAIEHLQLQVVEHPLALQGQLFYRPGERHLHLSALELQVGGSHHYLRGDVSPDQLDLQLQVERLPLDLASLWLPELDSGHLSADLQISGSPAAPLVSGQLAGATRYRGLALEISAEASADAQRISLQHVSGRLNEASVKASGTLLPTTLEADLQIQIGGITSDDLQGLQIPLPEALEFRLDQLQGELHGDLRNPDGAWQLQASGRYRQQPFRLAGDLAKRGTDLSTSGLQLQLAEGEIEALGRLDYGNWDSNLVIDAQRLPLDLLALLQVQLPDRLAAQLTSQVHLSGKLQQPNVDGQVTLVGHYRELPFALSAAADHDGRRTRVDDLRLQLDGASVLAAEGSWDGTGLDAHLQTPGLDTDTLAFLDWPLPRGEIRAELNLGGSLQAPQLQGELIYDTQVTVFDEDSQATRTPLHWQLDIAQREDTLQLDSSIRLGSKASEQLHLTLHSQPLLDALLAGGPAQLRHAPLDLVVEGGLYLQTLASFLPENTQTLQGRLRADARVGGNLEQPQINGSLQLSDARYTNFATGTTIDAIDCRLQARASEVQLGSCTATDGQRGHFQLQGQARLPLQGDSGAIDLTLVSRNASILRRPDLESEVSGDIVLKGDFLALQAGGSLKISPFIAVLTPALTHQIPSIRVEDKPSQKAAEDAAQAGAISNRPGVPRVDLDLQLFARNQAYIRGRGLDAELEGELHIGGTLARPSYAGEFNTLRGSFKVFGKAFELERGAVNINTQALSLAVEGLYEKGERSVRAYLEGTDEELEIRFESTPPLPEDEIVSYIIFGKSVHDMSPIEALQLAAAINTLRGSDGFDPIASTRALLGADTLYIETEKGEDDTTGISVGVGKYLNEKVYIEVERTPNPSQPWKGQIEIELTPNLNLESSTGGKTGIEGAELKWKKNY